MISRYTYQSDELGRRTARADSGTVFAAQPTYGDSATVEMPAYNAYSYNTRSEVTGATRRWGTPGASGDLVLGQQYAYDFDSIGNRTTAAEGDTSRTASYTANALNQYTQRTVPDEKDLIGTAPTNVVVAVNQNPVSRQSAYWHHAMEVTNAASVAYPQVAITAVYNPPGTNDPDVVTSQTGHVFVAKTPEQFTYDDDGNLTQDGRFDYTWNGENRLIKAETRDDLPAEVPREKVDYLYDHQSRRIASATAVWTNDNWQAIESRTFVYDGWNVVTELTHSQTHTRTNLYTWGLDLSGTLQGAGGIGGLLTASLDGTTALYCHDANGNVTQLVSTDGELLAHYEYSPFGDTVVSIGSLAKANPFRFSTKWFDNDTNLGYWGYRWYSPSMGQWSSRDPLEQKMLFSLFSDNIRIEPLYVFVLNSPLSETDYLGLACKWAVGKCTRTLWYGRCPTSIPFCTDEFGCIDIPIPESIQQRFNSMGPLHHDDVKAVECKGCCAGNGDCKGGEETVTIKGFFAQKIGKAISEWILSWPPLRRSSGWVPGVVDTRRPGPCRMQCVSKDRYDEVISRMGWTPSHYHLTHRNCQHWASFVLGW